MSGGRQDLGWNWVRGCLKEGRVSPSHPMEWKQDRPLRKECEKGGGPPTGNPGLPQLFMAQISRFCESLPPACKSSHLDGGRSKEMKFGFVL